MKKLLNISLFAFIIAIFVGCSTNTQNDPPPFEPTDFGAYYVSSPDLAEYQGIERQASITRMTTNMTEQDTIVITQSKKFSFDIESTDWENYRLSVKFRWPKLNPSTLEGLDLRYTNYKTTGKVTLHQIGFITNPVAINFGISYNPNASSSTGYTLITLRNPSGAPLQTIKINTTGMDSTVAYMLQYQ